MEKGISKEGVQFYHDLIDELLKNGLICSHDLLHFSLSFQRSVTGKKLTLYCCFRPNTTSNGFPLGHARRFGR